MAELAAQLEKVSRMFGRFPALRQVTANFEVGRCYVLLGENGAGKSTLLRILAGLLQPSSGAVSLFSGKLGSQDRPPQLRARVGYMSHAPMLYDELSAVENLRYFASLYRTSECLTPEAALHAVALDPALDRPVGQYSQGMRQRASLARVLLSQPELVLLDEPFSNMDAASARQMVALISSWRASQRTVVLTTHQREIAAPLADYFLSMEAGRLVSVTEGPAMTRAAASWAEARPI